MIRNVRVLFHHILLIFLILFLLTGCGAMEEAVLSEDVSADTEKSDIEEISADTDTEQSDSEEGELVKASSEEAEEINEDTEQPVVPEAVKVKGIYVTGPIAGTEKMDELITLVEETELNAMVIDIKNDEGKVTYKMQSDTVLEIESGVRYIQDIDALVEKLHENDIYLIARIVAFKDPYLAEKKPELSLKTEAGEVFRDKNGEAWVNPYKEEVWDYLMEIGIQAAEAGFDEIQFDYIRFSTDMNAYDIDYGENDENRTKEEVIAEFTKHAYDTLHPLGVMVSADVFGTIIDNESDAEIVGQNYQEMAAHLDYICPMVYPSHYSNGVYNIEVPDKAPYDTVFQALNASKEKLKEIPIELKAEDNIRTAGVRVWIQDFTATWLKDYLSYGPKEIRAQIQAVYDTGYEEWILWNARMNYTEGALLPNWQESVNEEKLIEEETAYETESAEEKAVDTIETAEP